MKKRVFVLRSSIQAPIENVFSWHGRAGAIQRLTPPWSPLTLISKSGNGIEKGVAVRLRLYILGIPFRWDAEHIQYQENSKFVDQQIKGPFSFWRHHHIFHSKGENTTIMEDRVEYTLPFGPLAWPFYGFAKKEFTRMFAYRHRVLNWSLAQYTDGKKMRILISGASGTMGSALVPFLRTCGHEVITLVRHRDKTGPEALFWDPDQGILDLEDAGPLDAVINLNGMDISRGRWTATRRKKIMDSRVKTTRLLSEKMVSLKKPPRVFISSSAIGYYGEGGKAVLTEEDGSGDAFISRVCREWERASFIAQEGGIRTVQLRIGVVLTPGGGALQRMLLPFKFGAGTRLSHGRQFVSWISMEDVLGGILHILNQPGIHGPVNLTAPHPVSNKRLTQTLGRVLSRPAFFVMPAWVAKLLWGEMGQETLLTSARVMPTKLMESGFEFVLPKLSSALAHMLGITLKDDQ